MSIELVMPSNHRRGNLLEKTDVGKDWGQEEKGAKEDELGEDIQVTKCMYQTGGYKDFCRRHNFGHYLQVDILNKLQANALKRSRTFPKSRDLIFRVLIERKGQERS